MIERKFQQADEELIQLRGNLKQYENLVEEYKAQVSWLVLWPVMSYYSFLVK